MTKSWQHCKNILIIRADNMGDVIMSSPAIRALKKSFDARITILTSSMAAAIVPYLGTIDDVLVFDLPWIKTREAVGAEEVGNLVQLLQQKKFDAVVIFTVFSQNPLPAAMIAYLAEIPLRLAYCRENPYGLLTDWIPDQEPYGFIQHQVSRDLQLVEQVGASDTDHSLSLSIADNTFESMYARLRTTGVDTSLPWLICHAGVSEKKREYPAHHWIAVARQLIDEKGFQVLFTGSNAEKQLCQSLAQGAGAGAFSVAGLFPLQEFIALVSEAPLLVSVNTGPVHIAAAVGTPVVVLYAQTNPQHTPWGVPSKVLEFEVEPENRSHNEIIQHLYRNTYRESIPMPDANTVVSAVTQLLNECKKNNFQDLNLHSST